MTPARPSYAIALIGVLLLGIGSTGAGATPDPVESRIRQAWEITWKRFFHHGTNTFADYISSYHEGRGLDHLPTAAEVKRQYPNPCGYGTGMEDGMILGGAMLGIIPDMYAVTGDENLRAAADKVFQGVRLCLTVHDVPGFAARNVCPEDGESIYINSSRDQVTHAAHGLWKYYRSPLPDEATKQQIRGLLSQIADRMIEYVIPENNYDFGRADGTFCPLSICRMWEVQAHEAARLPMIHAAAWDATGVEKYRTEWRRYATEAIARSAEPDPGKPAYAMLQMQCSLEVLHELEPDAALKDAIRTTMRHLGELSMKRTAHISGRLRSKTPAELSMTGPDWRQVPYWRNQKGYLIPQWGAYREIWHIVREAGESSMVPLMAPQPEIPAEQKERLRTIILESDYDRLSSCGIVYHIGAYWKARRFDAL